MQREIEREKGEIERERERTTKLFVQQSILNIFVHVSESNTQYHARFYMLISTR